MHVDNKCTKILGLSTISLLALTACGGGDETADGDITLTVMDHYTDEPQRGYFIETYEQCADDIGVTIEHEPVPAGQVPQTVLQRASSGTLPDVIALDTPVVIPMAEAGALLALDDFDLDVNVAENIQEASIYQDELYGVQITANTLGLFYNPEILEEAGVEPPETWDDLLEAARELTSDGRYGIAFSANASHEGAWQFLPFMWSNGGDETNLDTPEVAEAIQLWTTLVEEGSASEGVINWGQRDVFDQFVEGRAAMMINGPWYFPLFDGEDVEPESVAVPVNDPSQTSVPPQGGTVWTAAATGDEAHEEASAQFLECMGSNEVQLENAVAFDAVPSNPDLQADFIDERPEMEAFAEMVMNSRARTAQLGEDWPEAETIIYTALQLALTGEVSPEEAIATAMDEN